MSGFNPYGSPQYPPPQNQIYPQISNPANAPPPMQAGPHAPAGYPGGAPHFPYQPGYGYPGAHVAPAGLSYPNVTPSAPPPVGFGYPGMMPTAGFPTVTPTPVSKIEWVPSNPHSAPSLSDRAVVAGYEGHDGSPLWVIRSQFQGDVIPGKLAIKHRTAYVAWGGDENSVQTFEVCCANPETVRWVSARDGNVPPNAVPGGTTASGEVLYIGRAQHQGSLTPGKVHASHKCMYISFAGKEHPHKTYEVLCLV